MCYVHGTPAGGRTMIADDQLDYLECELWVLAGYIRAAIVTAFEIRCLFEAGEP